MSENKIFKKIPGEVLTFSKKERQGYIDSLDKKQIFELKELLERQDKILANKEFIKKLPDKGEKILVFRKKIQNELDYRIQIEKAAKLFSNLNVASKGKNAMNQLEWTGKCSEKIDETKHVELDSDDETDTLKILAQPAGSGQHKKKIIYALPEESLIKPEDIDEIHSLVGDIPKFRHIDYILSKSEKFEDVQSKGKPSFKPFKTTKTNVHDPDKEKERKLHKYWEITSATPPIAIHGLAKCLSLSESLKLQKEQIERLKEIQVQNATERLTNQLGLHHIGTVPKDIKNFQFRDIDQSSDTSSIHDNEEQELQDDEDNDKGTVVFTVDSIEY
ncbi:DNA-directed RNA polymerase II subunit GRINL1A [Prorops nasuta]|uniref:DNA-directed RNA polymerase II subunit GRINL1A n=1 Tax=Prorops nasuta TaxID=863751 RepID=UPI0034CE9B4B